MRLPRTDFICEPDPANPGWHCWEVEDKARFNGIAMGPLLVRAEADGTCRLRMFPSRAHANLPGTVHGGAILALIDIALFSSLWMLRQGDAAGSVTLEVHSQFIGAGELGEPLDAVSEILKETRRLAFLRGKVVQGDNLVAAYTGTMRKPTAP